MSLILALDTSTQACSCALNINGEVSESFEILPRQHAGKLLPMIKQLMDEHRLGFDDLDAVAYGQGPGSFTGLRIAAGVTQGIAMGAQRPVVAVSSLGAMAWQVAGGGEPRTVFSTLDARIDEVYWGFYLVSAGGVELLGSEGLCKPEDLPPILPDTEPPCIGVGSGLDYMDRMPVIYREGLQETSKDILPAAGAIAWLAAAYLDKGLSQKPEEVNPVYLRDKVTHD